MSSNASALPVLQWGGYMRIGGRAVAVEPAGRWIGGVIEREGGAWHIARWAYHQKRGDWQGWEFMLDDGSMVRTDPPDPAQFPLATPLLPPPPLLTPGPAAYAEALEALAKLPGAKHHGFFVNLAMESGSLWTFRADTKEYSIQIHTDSALDNYDARGRDHQKEGVLRQWLSAVAATAGGGVE